ncbi:NAD-binding protein [Streptomyces sp. NPDC059637]|uniref:NAD-binding protein n=1 Tax=Streptomyces sp. NPDC059637 TaxID=3347752 RepID=UPI00368E0BC3
MVVCGDDALAYRLARELAGLYGEEVTVLVPSLRRGYGPWIAALADDSDGLVEVLEVPGYDDAALLDAGVDRATALALTSEDDQENIHLALRARRLNPDVRLVVRLFKRKLGRRLEDLLDRAVSARLPGLDRRSLAATTTVLSDADTAAPALVAAAVAGVSKTVQADGMLLRAVERPASEAGVQPALCTLALMSAPAAVTEGGDLEGDGDSDPSDATDTTGVTAHSDHPRLLPADAVVAAADPDRRVIVLETITRDEPRTTPPVRLPGAFPLGSFFSRRLRAAIAGLAAVVVLFALLTWKITGKPFLEATHLALLDVFAIGEPALDEEPERRILQLLSALSGMLLLPLLLAVVLESYGTFRAASGLRRPPRGTADHVVLVGLGRIGTRVLDRLHALGIPVVCVERDQNARGIALARSLKVPVLVADATGEGVLEAARIGRSRALLALTSNDSINLETALYARECNPVLRVVLRLFDDRFAATVNQALRDSYPDALTRSRSVSALTAPSFAGAMMGRHVLGAVAVERGVLLIAAMDVGGCPELEGRTIAEAFRPGAWRVLALDLSSPDDRQPDLATTPHTGSRHLGTGLEWNLHPGHVLGPQDRVLLAATRRGLGLLQSACADPGTPAPERSGA